MIKAFVLAAALALAPMAGASAQDAVRGNLGSGNADEWEILPPSPSLGGQEAYDRGDYGDRASMPRVGQRL